MDATCKPAIANHSALWDVGAARHTKLLFIIVGFIALAYAFLAGFHTVTEADVGWQLATGRWIAQHHQIPSVDVFSYTARGQPWIYPVGSGLLLYAAYLVGKYTLLSWVGAAACVGTTALLLRRGSAVTAALAILAVPLIAFRTGPRSDMFTVVLFAAFLTLLWEQHVTGRARLWLLPMLMVAWVNLHLGLASGLALIGGYVLLEGLELLWPERRDTALEHLRRSWPWLIATFAAPLVNPWGWRIYSDMLGLMTPMAGHSSQWIAEWAPLRLTFTIFILGLSARNPNSLILLLLVVAIAAPVALARRQLGAALLLGGAALLAIRHMRFMALFGAIVVVIAGAVLTSALHSWRHMIEDTRIRSILAGGACCLLVVLVSVWSADLVTNRTYLWRNDVASFGTGLSWWFPEGAASFVEREKIPGEIFNSYDEGGYLTWRLGPHYRDYVDGRGDPFWPDFVPRSFILMARLPDSPEWQREAERYNINAMIIPLAYILLEEFPLLQQFCVSSTWRPVYLDETSAVFIRHTPETENLIQRLQIDCDTAPLPRAVPDGDGSSAYSQWANAAAVLKVLGRKQEALAATSRALAIFPDSFCVHRTRADVLAEVGNLRGAEQEYLWAATLNPNTMSWARLAKIYEQEHRLEPAIQAWKHATELDPDYYLGFLWLGTDYLSARRPQEALKAFDRAARSLPAEPIMGPPVEKSFYANLAEGRATAWKALGDVKRAVSFEEEAVRCWLELATQLEQEGRGAEAQQVRQHAAALNGVQQHLGTSENRF